MLAFITISDIDKVEPGYIHFKDKSQKAWNCNKPELFTDDDGELCWSAGMHMKIDYAETDPKPGRKPSKYINNARIADPVTEPNTWPDKEPWTGGNSGGGGSSVSNKKDNYDPEVSKRQTAANCAMAYLSNAGVTVDELTNLLPVVADIVLEYVSGSPKSDAGVSDSTSGDDFGSEEIDF